MEREERLRLSWVEAYGRLKDAGAVCRRFGISRPTLRKWLSRFEAEGAPGLCPRSRAPHHSPAAKVGPAETVLILELRRTRHLGVKRLRHELYRLHGLQLSPATIHKTLVRHALNVLPRRKRDRHKPRRYSRPTPGDRVQVDSCKIWPGLYQFAALATPERQGRTGSAHRAGGVLAHGGSQGFGCPGSPRRVGPSLQPGSATRGLERLDTDRPRVRTRRQDSTAWRRRRCL